MAVCIRSKGEEKMKAKAGLSFISNMQKPTFVAKILADAGVDQTPCFCCLNKVQKTCSHVVGEVGCKDYVLYSESPEKVEAKLHNRIAECLQTQQWLKQQRKAA